MLWPVLDTSSLPVRQRGQVGVRSRLNSPRRRRPGDSRRISFTKAEGRRASATR